MRDSRLAKFCRWQTSAVERTTDIHRRSTVDGCCPATAILDSPNPNEEAPDTPVRPLPATQCPHDDEIVLVETRSFLLICPEPPEKIPAGCII
jgi:hypothetical protein